MIKPYLGFLQYRLAHLFLITVLTFIAYSNIFQNEFVGDDVQWIVNWDIPKSLSNIPNIFTHNYGGNYRPMRTIFLMIDYQLFGLNPLGYHFVSLIPILLNPILVYLIIEKITKKRLIAFISSILFGVHPIHTESLALILGSVESIAFSFYLASFYLYLKSRDKLPKYTPVYYLSLTFAALAFLHNETTLSLPLIILFYDLVFKYLNLSRIKLFTILKIYGPYFAIALMYIFIRVVLLHIVGRGEYLAGSFYLTMLTMTKAFVKYIELLILPLNLSIYPNVAPGISSSIGPYARIDKILSQSILNLDILRNIGIILGLIAAIFIYVKKSPLISFAIGWFFLTLLPVSNIIPVGSIMQERYAYLASFGFVLLIGILFDIIYHYSKSLNYVLKLTLILFISLVLTGFTYRTYLRNKDWKDNITLWSKFIEQNPQHVHAHYMLARHYESNNYYDLAIPQFKKTLELFPDFPDAYLHIGNIYNIKGNRKEATANYLKDKARHLYKLEYSFNNNKTVVTFVYLKDWQTVSFDNGVKLLDPKNNFEIDIVLDKLSLSPEQYLQNDKQQYGNLINQGLASIPNFNSAYIRVWDDNGVNKLEFFLFKDNTVIKLTVFPAVASLMRIFDDIVSSVLIT